MAEMCANEHRQDGDLIAKEKYIHLLLSFLVRVKEGKGIDNLRMNINDVW